MKMFQSVMLAAALFLIPATSFAADAKADAKSAAKAAAKEKAKEKAKEVQKEAVHEQAKDIHDAREKKAEAAKDVAEATDEAKKAEDTAHSQHLGVIERLDQIASATNNAELTSTVSRLKDKESKRHTLATGG